MRDIRERVLEAAGLRQDLSAHVMRMYVEGNHLVSISGVRAVREYSVARMRLQVEGGQVLLYGANLELSAIGEGAAAVTGVIENVEFAMDGEGD